MSTIAAAPEAQAAPEAPTPEEKKMFYQREVFKLIKRMIDNHNLILAPRVLVDFMDGDHLSAIFLNQILYWTDRSSMNDGWFYKSHANWHEEIGFSPFQIRNRLDGDDRVEKEKRTLRDVGVQTRMSLIPGTKQPITYYRLNIAMFFGLLHDYLENHPKYDPNRAVEEHTDSYVDNVLLNIVGGRGSTMFTGGDEHCSTSSLDKEYKSENTTLSHPYPPDDEEREKDKTEQTKQEKFAQPNNTQPPTKPTPQQTAHAKSSAKPDDEDLKFILKFERNFHKLKNNQKTRLRAEISRLGQEKVLEVAERCKSSGGRSWNYLFAALEREDEIDEIDEIIKTKEESQTEEGRWCEGIDLYARNENALEDLKKIRQAAAAHRKIIEEAEKKQQEELAKKRAAIKARDQARKQAQSQNPRDDMSLAEKTRLWEQRENDWLIARRVAKLMESEPVDLDKLDPATANRRRNRAERAAIIYKKLVEQEAAEAAEKKKREK